MSRVTATERLQRILAVLPWIVQHQGATVQEICERFGLERKELIDDLDFVFYNVGLHPFTPDMLAEVTVEQDRVHVHIGDYFRRPLRLTHEEALTLLAAGRALTAREGTDPDHTLRRAVDKLAAVLGEGATGTLDVALGHADPDILDTVRRAAAQHRRVRIDYYSYARDATSTREVDPLRVLSRDGRWYLLGHCHEAGGERMFRIDRIRTATSTDTEFEPPQDTSDGSLNLSLSPRSVEIIAPAAARWVSETYPCDEFEQQADGRIRMVLPVTATAWLERLLLRLGPTVEVRDVSTGEDLAQIGKDAAARSSARYR